MMNVSKELRQRRAIIRERERLFALRYVDSRPIRWKEASSLIRRLRWKPYVTRYKGIRIIAADKWGKEVRIAAVSSWQKMTPARFWHRLRKIDPYRVAEVERNIF